MSAAMAPASPGFASRIESVGWGFGAGAGLGRGLPTALPTEVFQAEAAPPRR